MSEKANFLRALSAQLLLANGTFCGSWVRKTRCISLVWLSLVCENICPHIEPFLALLVLISLKSSFTLRVCWQRKRSLYCSAMQRDRLHLFVSKLASVSVALSTGHRWYLTLTVPLSKASSWCLYKYLPVQAFVNVSLRESLRHGKVKFAHSTARKLLRAVTWCATYSSSEPVQGTFYCYTPILWMVVQCVCLLLLSACPGDLQCVGVSHLVTR